ncbi:PaaI family thioesterase [Variovorax sp. PAMC 28711]|uniref:PaaI family thioesterase n=1 Tax=Variovorax sp. PAMC 28711 TaxID=1795631 RepID=UPI00078DFD2C|nr:PaaI family thioesterase [Variovorax sp. PAMC 28711]AMM24384.1 phenylacetic acid degradation protein [Variovorax sp. PAMC 28711]
MSASFDSEATGELFGLPIPLAQVFCLRGEAIGHDRAQVRMPFNALHTNSRGAMHGGALAVLLDCTLASAARAHDPVHFGVVTVDMTLHFVTAASGEVVASAFCERRGRSLCFVRGEARDARGTLLALATGTFKLVARAASPDSTSDTPSA